MPRKHRLEFPGAIYWVFRSNLDTDSVPNWTPVPFQTGQSFQRKLDTDSAGKLDIFRVATGMGCRTSVDGNAALVQLLGSHLRF